MHGTVIWSYTPDPSKYCQNQAPFPLGQFKSALLYEHPDHSSVSVAASCIGGSVFEYNIPLKTVAVSTTSTSSSTTVTATSTSTKTTSATTTSSASTSSTSTSTTTAIPQFPAVGFTLAIAVSLALVLALLGRGYSGQGRTGRRATMDPHQS